jgi:hypothetical protein
MLTAAAVAAWGVVLGLE